MRGCTARDQANLPRCHIELPQIGDKLGHMNHRMDWESPFVM